MAKVKIGDVVINEYGHVGKVLAIEPVDEVEMSVFDYGIEGDTDYCSWKKCRLASEEEILKAFNKPI